MRDIKFCIGIPAYNTELELLEKCLISIKEQTYKQFNVIFVDDCSTNDLCSISKVMLDNDERFIFYKNCQNLGATNTRSLIASRAVGDYFIWVDSDDCLEMNYLENIVKIIRENNVDINGTTIVTDAFLHYKNRKIEKLYGFNKNKIIDSKTATNLVLADRYLKSYPWSYVIPVNTLKSVNYVNAIKKGKTIIDDLAVTFQYVLLAKNVLLSNVCGYHHFFGIIGSDSNTGNLRKRIIETSFFLLEENIDCISVLTKNCIKFNIIFNESLLLKNISENKKIWKNNIKYILSNHLKKTKINIGMIKLITFKFYLLYFLLKYFTGLFCRLMWDK